MVVVNIGLNTPMKRARKASGARTDASRTVRSAIPRLAGFVTSPYRTRCTIHRMYAAARITPRDAKTTSVGLNFHEPTRIRNSPTNPLKPGTAIDDSEISRKIDANQGISVFRPPKSAICRVWRRS
jgi:hypothetical protein